MGVKDERVPTGENNIEWAFPQSEEIHKILDASGHTELANRLANGPCGRRDEIIYETISVPEIEVTCAMD